MLWGSGNQFSQNAEIVRASFAYDMLKVNGTRDLNAISTSERKHFLITLVVNGILMQRVEASNSYQDREVALLSTCCISISHLCENSS